MFEDIIYPKEITQIMIDVLAGRWDGGNPEQAIDTLLGEFYSKQPDKYVWGNLVVQAVKQLGCLDIIYARLNLECLLQPHEGDRISIRYQRQRLLPGENHGVGCRCGGCVNELLRRHALGIKPFYQPDKDVLQAALTARDEAIQGPPPKQPDKVIDQTVDGDPVLDSYPDDQKTLDDLEDNFYAKEREIKRDLPRPSLTPERKTEVLEFLRQTGYQCTETREKAWERLEKLLKRRSCEQSIIGRLGYLLVFEALKGFSGRKFLIATAPQGLLPFKNMQ